MLIELNFIKRLTEATTLIYKLDQMPFEDTGTHIVIECPTEGAEIRYTTDDSEPTKDSNLYSEPILIICNGTFRARAYAEGLFESAVSDFTVSNMMMMMPHANCEDGILSLSVWDESGSIWYTLDPEAAPEDADAWTLYTEPIELTKTCTVRFFARRIGFIDSAIATYEFEKENSERVDTIDADGLKICKEGGKIVVYTDKSITLPVYTLDGHFVKTVKAAAGRNVIDGLDSNIYIIGNLRIKL